MPSIYVVDKTKGLNGRQDRVKFVIYNKDLQANTC